MRRLPITKVLLGISFALATWNAGLAQEQNAWSESGIVKDVGSSMVSLKSANDHIWLVRVDPKTKLQVDGTAEAGYLHSGLNVKFSGEIDKKGVLQSEIKQIEIFTPQDKRSIGLFAEGAQDAKPVRNAPPGRYEIKARVNTYKDGQLTVSAGGKKITGKVAPDAEIKVNAGSLTFVQEGDSVRASGWRVGPTQAMATELTVTLAKPLAGVVKKSRPAKSPRTPRGAPPPVQDPFGAGGDSKEK